MNFDDPRAIRLAALELAVRLLNTDEYGQVLLLPAEGLVSAAHDIERFIVDGFKE